MTNSTEPTLAPDQPEPAPATTGVAATWSAVTVDCLDPERVARFWSALLNLAPGPSEPGWVYLGHRDDVRPRLVFQPVSEPNPGKVRIHLDVTVDDLSAAVARVAELGGSGPVATYQYDAGTVLTMADPEGHEFCLACYADAPS